MRSQPQVTKAKAAKLEAMKRSKLHIVKLRKRVKLNLTRSLQLSST